MRRSSRCSSFPNRALPPLPGLSLLGRSLLGLLDLPDPLGGREEDGLSDDEGLPDEGLPDPLDGRDEDGLSDDEGPPDQGLPDEGLPDEGLPDEGLPDPLDGRDEELLPEDLLGGRDDEVLSEDDGLSDEGLPDPLDGRDELELLLGLSDPDCLGVLPESLTIQQM